MTAPLPLSRLGLGTAALGHLYRPVDDAEAAAVIHAAYAAGIRFFDTAHLYGGGLAEKRLGDALASYPRASYRVSTKLGVYRPYGQAATPPGSTRRRAADVWDFSPARTEAALATSLERLRTDYLDIVHVHSFDNHFEAAREGAFATVAGYRERGVVRAVGGGSDAMPPLLRAMEEGLLDAFLTAGRHTLIDRSAAEQLLPRAASAGVEVIVGGVFNSGILATGAKPDARFDYDPAPPAVRERVTRMQQVCETAGVPLRAAALQFPLRHPGIGIVLLGPASVAELEDSLAMLALDIPDTLWAALDAVASAPAGSLE